MKLKLIALMIIAMVLSPVVHARLYKWADENGVIHFGDTIPLKYRVRKHVELNEQGATIKTHAAQETKAERLEKLRLERLQQEEDQRVAEQRKKDKGLLDTYTTERDLIAARDARLEAASSQLQLSESIINDTQRKLDETDILITRIKVSGRGVPKNILDKMMSEKTQLKTYKKVAATHQEKKDQIHLQFDEYLARFRILKAGQQRKKEEREAQRRIELGLDLEEEKLD